MILVTGSEGLVGRHVSAALSAAGHAVRPFDLARAADEDVCRPEDLARALDGVTGVLHLAAVSRIALAERDPGYCDATNVDALDHLLRLCLERRSRPWVIFVSSREAYGLQGRLPVSEDAALEPINVYARSKVRGERLVQGAASAGLMTNICRLSNVYGCPHDHPDRVAMAFAAAAARGGLVQVAGPYCLFDFTWVEDVAGALLRLVEATIAGERLPPLHFVSGSGTTLGKLAAFAAGLSAHHVEIVETPARTFGVSRFVGNPERARALLGWQATTPIRSGFATLVGAIEALDAARRAPAA